MGLQEFDLLQSSQTGFALGFPFCQQLGVFIHAERRFVNPLILIAFFGCTERSVLRFERIEAAGDIAAAIHAERNDIGFVNQPCLGFGENGVAFRQILLSESRLNHVVVNQIRPVAAQTILMGAGRVGSRRLAQSVAHEEIGVFLRTDR